MRLKSVIVTILVFFIFTSQRTTAQSEKDFWDKIYLGGSFGLQFGDYTYVDLAPQIGYRMTDRWTSGIGLTYIYLKYNDPVYHYSYSSNVYGGSLFTRYLVYNNLFLYAELEQLNQEVFDYFLNESTRVWTPAFFVGGGLRQPIGDRSSFQVMLLYDMIQDRYSPYINPIIRIGFGVGF